MRIRTSLCILPMLGFHLTLAQVASEGTDDHRIVPFKEYLHQRGIGLSVDAISLALGSPDPQVRSAAAFALAEDEGKASINPIEEALRTEQNPYVAIQLSDVLSGLDDPLGQTRLTQFCSDTQLPAEMSTLAMTYMLNRDKGEGCIDATLARLKGPYGIKHKSQLLLLLAAAYARASEKQKSDIAGVAEDQLKDADAYNRIIASQVLSRVSPARASQQLQRAMASEADPNVRESMKLDYSTAQSSSPHNQ